MIPVAPSLYVDGPERTVTPPSDNLDNLVFASAHNSVRRQTTTAGRWARIAYLICLAVHVWLISAGFWGMWPRYTARYDLLARGFAVGQTNLLIKPDPRMLALPDPYDPKATASYRHRPGIPDSCLYDGKLYLYWGPVPALFLTPLRYFVSTETRIGDHYLTFIFVQGTLIAIAALLVRLRSRYFPHLPAWLPAAGMLFAGLSAPVAVILTRAAVYEAAIAGGQCFLLWGILLAWIGLERTNATGSNRRLELTSLALAGLCLALAVGCRISLAVAVFVVGLLICFQIIRGRWPMLRSAIPPSLAFGLPLATGAILLAGYNYIRFQSPFEFGQKYQLAEVNLRSYPSLFGIANVWPSLWSYFIRPIATTDRFPYVLLVRGEGNFPSIIHLPEHYECFERIGGMLWTVPLLAILPLSALSKLLARRRVTGISRQATTAAKPTWITSVLLLSAALGFLPVLLMIGSSQRYLVDLTPPLVPVLLVSLGWLCDPERVKPVAIRRRLAIAFSLGLISSVLGVLLAFEGYGGHFRIQNPDLFEQLSGSEPVLLDPDHTASADFSPAKGISHAAS